MLTISWKNVGPPNTPQEIKRARRQVMDMMRLHGQPVVHMHMWNTDDVENSIAKACPGCFDNAYEQVRNDCTVCYGVGWVSIEDAVNGTYIDTRGRVVFGDPGTGQRAPRYGGFGPRTLTYVIQPDKAEDVFKLDRSGVLVKVQNAETYAPWYPDISDNDLLVNVRLLPDSSVWEPRLYYQTKMSNPQSIRGFGGRTKGLREEEYLVGQQFEMALIPENTILREVPIVVE